ncbi:MAG TPA: pseudouridine-5'-phosphate glycosidase, partial [Anaerolinea sp.]|nr:pseudouridine-5'-phosphate glycosidase [Anaerolinea sp.]
THGLPRPENLELARALEDETRAAGVTPATIAVIDGKVHVGLEPEEMQRLAEQPTDRKISRRDFGIALAKGQTGGTTVAGTLIAAEMAGIRVFATGGIGGVHRGNPPDVSADLPELSRRKVIVVCAGAKAILDLPATVEYLETMGVPVIGYRTEHFPAFYTSDSGLRVDARVESADEAARIAQAHWDLGLEGAVLVVQPPPEEAALQPGQIDAAIRQALDEAAEQGLRGAALTPFLLGRVSQLSGGDSLRANLALLRSNARLGAQIAASLPNPKQVRI